MFLATGEGVVFAAIWDLGIAPARANTIGIARLRRKSSGKSSRAIAASITGLPEKSSLMAKPGSAKRSGGASGTGRKASSS